MVYAEPYKIKYVCRLAGEEFSEEYCVKKTRLSGNKRLFV
jgi:hypothetical protein